MLFQLKKSIILNTDLNTAWDFFSDPKNLKKITPPDLNMTITSELPDKMYEGMIISYKVYPILKIPLPWVTEITKIVPNKMFIDEQRYGPYKLWHHEHFFEELDHGVKASDIVSYIVPFGPLGLLVQKLKIGQQIDDIFKYRSKVLEETFGIL